jgi:hypothetical protein
MVSLVYFVIMHVACCYTVKLRMYSVYFFGEGVWSFLKCITSLLLDVLGFTSTVVPPYPLIQYLWFTVAPPKFEN